MSRMIRAFFILAVTLVLGSMASAQSTQMASVTHAAPSTSNKKKISKPAVLSFKDWKESQVLEAKNQVVRLSNRVLLLKKGVLKVEKDEKDSKDAVKEELGTDRVRASNQTDQIMEAEAQLKTALESLQFTTELSLKDYFSVYLSRFKDQPEALNLAAQKLSKEEVVELLKVTIKEEAGGTAGTGDRNATQLRGALVESLSPKPL